MQVVNISVKCTLTYNAHCFVSLMFIVEAISDAHTNIGYVTAMYVLFHLVEETNLSMGVSTLLSMCLLEVSFEIDDHTHYILICMCF